MNKAKLFVSHDGYIEYDDIGNITWAGVWANNVRSIFYKTAREFKLEANNQLLSELIKKLNQ